MMMVAGPVTACSASFLVGVNSSLVEYSVHFPINHPASSAAGARRLSVSGRSMRATAVTVKTIKKRVLIKIMEN